MKKLLILTCAMCVLNGIAIANEPVKKPDFGKREPGIEFKRPNPEQMKEIRKAHERAFDQKLGLTEVQKLKAKELRKAGHEKMKPVMEQIKTKKQEAEAIRNSKLTVQEKEEKLAVIDNDLAGLKKQAKEIKKQNMKDFEAILTKDQKKILKNMKKEGRKNFDKHKKEFEQQRKELVPPPTPPVERK